jgi:hypothetical protein
MTDEPGANAPSRSPATHGRRFKPHEIDLADGSRLVLSTDGSIDHIDDRGSRVHRWELGDPEWPDQAIRFGLHPQAPTITPQGRYVQGTKPPRR